MVNQENDPEEEQHFVFARPVDPVDMEYTVKPRKYSRFKGLVASYSLINPRRWTYRSKFLDMEECPQTIKTRNLSAETTYAFVKVFRKMPRWNIAFSSTETAQVGYWLLQHFALILYEFDSKERKLCAAQSFPQDVVGCWGFPDGDLAVLPRQSPDEPVELFLALKDMEKFLKNLTETRGPCNQKLVNTDRDDECFKHLKITKGRISTNDKILVPLLFKPIFYPQYFKFENPSEVQPKKMFVLDLLQKASLLLFHISDLATASKRYGSALLFALGMSVATQLMDLLLQTSLLEDKLAYTHFLTRYCLANCFFRLSVCFEGYDDEYLHFYRTRTDMASFFSVVKIFEERHREEVGAPKYKEILALSREPADSASQAVEIFSSLGLPNNWNRSSFRKAFATVLRELFNMRCVTENDRKSVNLRIEQFRGIHERLSSHEVDVVEELERTQHYCILVINRLLMAKCMKYLASLQASRKLVLLYNGTSVRREENTDVLVETYGVEGPLSDSEYELYKQMEVQQIAAMTSFKELPGSHKKSARQAFIASQKEILFEQVFLQIEIEDRMLESCPHPCTVSNLVMAFNMAMAPFEEGISSSRSEMTAFNQMAGAFCFGLSHIYLTKHFREHKSNREKKQMWLSNSGYYHQLTAMYLRRPGVGIALLQMAFNNAERAKSSYTAGLKWSRHLPAIVLLALRRMLLMLPLVWELCIMEGIRSPVNYVAVIRKDVGLPCSLDDLEKVFTGQTMAVFNQINDGLQFDSSKYLKPFKMDIPETSRICRAIDTLRGDLILVYAQSTPEFSTDEKLIEIRRVAAKQAIRSLMLAIEEKMADSQGTVAEEAGGIASFLAQHLNGEREFKLPNRSALTLFCVCFGSFFAIAGCKFLGASAANLNSRTQLCLYANNSMKERSVEECISLLFTEGVDYRFTTLKDFQAHLFQAVSGLMDNLSVVMLNGEGDMNSFVPQNISRLLKILHAAEICADIRINEAIDTFAAALVHSVVNKFPEKAGEDTESVKGLNEQKFVFPSPLNATPISEELSRNLTSKFSAKTGWADETPEPSTSWQPDPLSAPVRNYQRIRTEGEYDPYTNVDDFIKNDEESCPGFEDEHVGATFERLMGDFYGQKNCTTYKRLVSRLTSSYGSTVKRFQKSLFKIEQDLATRFPDSLRKTTFDGPGGDEIEMSEEFFKKLDGASDGLFPEDGSLFGLASSLFKIDQLLFKGRTGVILRGSLPEDS